MSQIKSGFTILFVSLILWIGIDFIFTKKFNITSFSQFFTHDNEAGRINKPGFQGFFGGPLEDFFSSVSIGQLGERNSTNSGCDFINQKIIFLGDSTTAGFEVNDNETFVSLFNQSCNTHLTSGINFGVRGHDTHMVLATYQKIKKSIFHNKIFYLISVNDFNENIDPLAYQNMTERFGRVYDGQLINPISKFTNKSLYLDIRVFIGKNFYLTTKLISYIELINKYFFAKEGNNLGLSDLQVRFNMMEVLLNNLAIQARNEGADLYIAIYPNLSQDRPLIYGYFYEEMLLKTFKNHPINIKVLELEKYVETKSRLGCLKRSEMRFRNDGHLSKFGHKVISDFLRAELVNDHSLTLDSLCYK
jgi:lysophospholipase L1-like esterase